MERKELSAILVLGLQLALILVLFGLALDVPGPAAAAVAAGQALEPRATLTVGGVITQSTTWDLAHSPYVLTSDVVVTNGVTLTIESGVVVAGRSGMQLTVLGHLDAAGGPVLFTSENDDGPGQWQGLVFDGGSGHLDGATVRYAGQLNDVARCSIAVRDVVSSEVRIENSQVISGADFSRTDYGLYAENSNLVVDNTTFARNGNTAVDRPLRLAAADLHRVQLSGNTLAENASNRILVAGGVLGGSALLAAQTEFEGYEIGADVDVPAGVTLTLEPGLVVLVQNGAQLQVQGHLAAVGNEPILFTSAGDTGPGQWQGLVFDGGTGHLRDVTVRYAGQANGITRSNVTVRDVVSGEVRIENSQIISVSDFSGTDYGLYADNSNLVVANTTFAGNGNTAVDKPLRLAAADLHRVQLDGSTFAHNASDRIFVAGGTMGGTASLSTHQGLESYQLAGALVVPAGITLTVEPNVVVMANSQAYLEVQGHLQAVGDDDEPIFFTSEANTGPGQWAGLVFHGGTGNLRSVTIRYAGQTNTFARSSVAVHDVVSGWVRFRDSQVVNGANTTYTDYGLHLDNGRLILDNSSIVNIGSSLNDFTLYATQGSILTATHSTFHNGSGYGLWLLDSQASLYCSAVTANQNEGIHLQGDSPGLSMEYTSIEGNGDLGLNNTTPVTVEVPLNWWGHASGPYHPGLNPGGLGQEVSDRVRFVPWLDEPKCIDTILYIPFVIHEASW